MRVHAIDGTEAEGVRMALVVLQHAEQAPDGSLASSVSLRAVMDAHGGTWFVLADRVQRMLDLACGCHAELTTYQDGSEIDRTVGPAVD